MARYEVAVRTPAALTVAPFATLHTVATDRAMIREIGIFSSTATAASVGLIRASNTPVATTSALGQAADPGNPAGTVDLDTAWSTAPTVGTIFLRRISLPANTGAGVIWTWQPGADLVLAISSWLVFWNFGGATGPALDVYVAWDE